MKKKLTMLLTFMLLCLAMNAISVSAADERLGTVVDGSLLTDGTDAEYTGNPDARGTYLSYGTGGIAIVAGRTLNVNGATTCYSNVDEVKVRLLVQRLEGNTWVTVYSVPTKTAYNTYRVSTSKDLAVAGGYYYRVTGTHTAIKGSVTESSVSSTGGLWVS